MKVILAVCGTKRYLGINKYFYFLAKHLTQQMDYHPTERYVELIADSQEGVRQLHEVAGNYRDTPIQCTVIRPATGGLLNVPNTALWCLKLAQYLKNRDFDILHTCHVNPFFYLMSSSRKPVVFQPFGNELFTLEETVRYPKKLYYKLTQPVLGYCGHYCDALAVEGQFQWDEMVRWYDNEKAMFTLPEAIDIEYIEKTVEDAWGTVKRDPYQILAVNSLYPYEGMDILIEAFRIIKRHIPQAHLLIIGSGPEWKRIHQMVDSYNLSSSFRLFSEIPERTLYRYYAQSGVFVSTSMERNFLMTIMEAEALGCPIVSTGQDWLIDENGYLVSRSSIEIANAILKVFEGDMEAMGKRSREIVAQYDFKNIAKVAIEKYREVLKWQ